MDPKHRTILKQKNIRKDLNLKDGLFTQLITRKLLNQRMVRRIKNIRSTDKQAKELLYTLRKRGPGCFDLFCEALIADDQGSFVTEFLKPKSSEKLYETKSKPAEDGNGVMTMEADENIHMCSGLGNAKTPQAFTKVERKVKIGDTSDLIKRVECNTELIQYIYERLTRLESNEGGVVMLQADIKSVKDENAILKAENAILKAELDTLKAENKRLKVRRQLPSSPIVSVGSYAESPSVAQKFKKPEEMTSMHLALVCQPRNGWRGSVHLAPTPKKRRITATSNAMHVASSTCNRGTYAFGTPVVTPTLTWKQAKVDNEREAAILKRAKSVAIKRKQSKMRRSASLSGKLTVIASNKLERKTTNDWYRSNQQLCNKCANKARRYCESSQCYTADDEELSRSSDKY